MKWTPAAQLDLFDGEPAVVPAGGQQPDAARQQGQAGRQGQSGQPDTSNHTGPTGHAPQASQKDRAGLAGQADQGIQAAPLGQAAQVAQTPTQDLQPGQAGSPSRQIATPCPPTLPPGARWRETATPQQTIGYVLLRSRRRSIGFVIGDDGLRVTAPNWVTLGQIDDAVREKSRWILAKLRDWHARQERLALSHTRWQAGGELPYLGRRIVLQPGPPPPEALALAEALADSPAGHGRPAHATARGDDAGYGGPAGATVMEASPRRAKSVAARGVQAVYAGDPDAPQDGDMLWLALPLEADHTRIRDSAQAWLQRRAAAWFDARLKVFLSASGLSIKRWRLSSATTRWGSCTSDGHIMLNWRLIHFAPDIVDYVIAHELAHLREMNHSRDFWAEVEQILPGFQDARDALRRHDPADVPLL